MRINKSTYFAIIIIIFTPLQPPEKSATGTSGAGMGKDMSTILGASEDEDDEDKGDGSDKEAPDTDKAAEEADPSARQPLKMVINKESGVKGRSFISQYSTIT